VATCSFCGATSAPASTKAESGGALDAEDSVPLTWVTSYENGNRRVYCERCSREHLRAIESKLDSEWW
jgi:hypothetical protein